MRPLLFMYIQMAKRYRKKHNLPDHMVVDEEFMEKINQKHAEREYDVFTLDEKVREGLDIKKIDLPNISSYYIKKAGNPKDKIVYYIHGGGFVNGCTRQLFPFISYFVKHFGYDIYSVDYRLTPQYTFMDTIQDCEDGYKVLLETYDPKDIILMGESAGGNLVLALPHKLRDDGLPFPGGIIASSPVVQFLHYAYSYYENSCKTDYGIIFGINQVTDYYAKDLPLNHPYLSPLCGDLSGYPSVYLDASNRESLRDEARMMYVLLKEKGTDVEYHELRDFGHAQLTDVKHGFVKREEHPLVKAFIKKIFGE